MRYERFPPSPGLADYVEHFWLIEADLGERRHEEILVPNGRPTLLLSLGDEGWRKDPHTGGEEPNCSGLTGIATGPVLIGQTGQVHLVAAQLSPFGPAALGLPCAIDRHMALDTLPGGAPLLAGIRAAGISRAAVERLDTMLLARLNPIPVGIVEILRNSYALLGEKPADARSWADRTGVSEDRLYRLFKVHIGISPKTALMIARYQALVGSVLGEERGGGFAQLALLEGYYDQAHANRDFRRFTGVSPRQFRQTLNGIARMMHDGPDLSKKADG